MYVKISLVSDQTRISPVTKTVIEGEDVRFTCILQSAQWYFNNMLLPPDIRVQNNFSQNIITISQATTENNGFYYCSGIRIEDGVKVMSRATLSIQSK